MTCCIAPSMAIDYTNVNSLPGRDIGDAHLVGEPISINGIPEGIANTPAPIARPVPFSWFRAELTATSNPARVFLSGSFVLGMGSDGIEIESEPVKVSFSNGGHVLFDEVLPAGSFRRVGHKWAIFEAGSHRRGIRQMRFVGTNVRGRSSLIRHRARWRYRSRSVTTAGPQSHGAAATAYSSADE
jgi:hypothetical protein